MGNSYLSAIFCKFSDLPTTLSTSAHRVQLRPFPSIQAR
jgi:hypothetical protein